MRFPRQIASIVVQFLAEQSACVDQIGGFFGRSRILPIDVQTVESLMQSVVLDRQSAGSSSRDNQDTHKVLQQLHTRLRKSPPPCLGRERWCKVGAQTPPADTEQRLHITIGFLMQVKLLEVPKQISRGIGREITVPGFLNVGPSIRQVRFASLVIQTRKGIQHVCQSSCWDVLRWGVSGIDGPADPLSVICSASGEPYKLT